MHPLSLIACALAAAHRTYASPTLHRRQSITTLSTTEINAFTPYTHYASTAYCQPSATLSWNCGANCKANPNFQPTASGGDGTDTQFWYVGFDPSLKTVIVAHQGTDPSSILADLTDAEIILTQPDTALFPGLPSGILVHSGFAASHARSALDVLSAVNKTLSKYPSASVTVVGHSLGAALALLDSAYLSLHIPSGTNLRMVGYGMPRVGNQQWADYIDSNIKNVMHVNNKEDPIPVVPPMLLEYRHPSGEIHIKDTGAWVACPGQDNPSTDCIVDDVPTVFQGNVGDHDGPYNGITMGC